MKFILVILVGCTILSCKEEKKFGSLTGNIYWKYNDFVGNKPDAGSYVQLLSIKDSNSTFETSADIQGNYRFDDIPVGEYLVLIKSKNTTGSGSELLATLSYHILELDRIYHSQISDSIFEGIRLCRKIDSARYAIDFASDVDNNRRIKNRDRLRDSANSVADKYLAQLPLDMKVATFVNGTGSNKVDIQYVRIENKKTKTTVTDFGITYF